MTCGQIWLLTRFNVFTKVDSVEKLLRDHDGSQEGVCTGYSITLIVLYPCQLTRSLNI